MDPEPPIGTLVNQAASQTAMDITMVWLIINMGWELDETWSIMWFIFVSLVELAANLNWVFPHLTLCQCWALIEFSFYPRKFWLLVWCSIKSQRKSFHTSPCKGRRTVYLSSALLHSHKVQLQFSCKEDEKFFFSD